MSASVLAVAAHPDDETLGCGGTLLRHRARGDEVHWLIATRAHAPRWPLATIERKRAEVEAVARAYGASVHELGLPAAGLDRVPTVDVIEAVRRVVLATRPRVVYCVHGGDVHSDHTVVYEATLATIKAFSQLRQGVERVLCYETLSSTDAAPPERARAFVPNVFHDIGPYLDRKLEILGLYASELQADPLPRAPSAVRALARVRGASVGVEHAEAFALVREIAR